MTADLTLLPQHKDLIEASAITAEVAEPALDLDCPSCGSVQQRRYRIVARSARRAAKQSITPELVDVCEHCGTVFVVALWPGLVPP